MRALGNCSDELSAKLKMLRNSSIKAVAVFKEKFACDILSVESDFEYALACYSLVMTKFDSHADLVSQAGDEAIFCLIEFANACAVYSRFDLHSSLLKELAHEARKSSAQTRFFEVSLSGVCETLAKNFNLSRD